MDAAIWAAIVGSAGTVVAATIPLVRLRRASNRNAAYEKVTGTIALPEPHHVVGRTFKCSGSATGIQPGLTLWLAVEATVNGRNLVWPREGRVDLDRNNGWSQPVFEDGATDEFSVALYVADGEAERRIEKWLEKGRTSGTYAEVTGIWGARRLARVDGLRLA